MLHKTEKYELQKNIFREPENVNLGHVPEDASLESRPGNSNACKTEHN